MQEEKKIKKHRTSIFSVIAVILVLLSVLAGALLFWLFSTWAHLSMDELVFHMNTSLEGAGKGMILEAILKAGLPFLTVSALILFLYRKCIRKFPAFRVNMIFLVCSLALTATETAIAWTRLDLGNYLKKNSENSEFIKDNYLDPGTVKLEFPEKKRNLVFIFLESMEITYADAASGGAFERNVIPNLTQQALEFEDFSGTENTLNGALVVPGCTWTMGGIFGETSGLPLKIGIGENNMDTQDSFFSRVTTMGDLLEEEGYRNLFLLGSNVNFGGRKLYFSEHGDFELHDYYYARDHGIIPEDHLVFWGHEDEYLFREAKDELTKLAGSDQPFCVTLLTVDTHFENGYVCGLCGDEFGSNQYANVFACSDRQVSQFVDWLQEQDFYENTTVVLIGDHTTMDKDFCDGVPEEYTRKIYTNFINSAVQPEDPQRKREYTQLDIFPTTMAALGVKWKENRLGLGTNLFSAKNTLLEELGPEQLFESLESKSEFMEELAAIENNDELLSREEREPRGDVVVTAYDPSDGKITVRVTNILNIEDSISNVHVVIHVDGEEGTDEADCVWNKDDSYTAQITTRPGNLLPGTIDVVITAGDQQYSLEQCSGELSLMHTESLAGYLRLARSREDFAMILCAVDEASYSMPWTALEEMRAMGLEAKIEAKYRNSYVAVIDHGVLFEDVSKERVIYHGTLSSGATLRAASFGFYAGSLCCCIINDKEYRDSFYRGLHVFLYDTKEDKFVQACSFDTHKVPNGNCLHIEPDEEQPENWRIFYDKIYSQDVWVELWDEQCVGDPRIINLTFEDKENGYEAIVTPEDLEGIDLDHCWMRVMNYGKGHVKLVLARFGGPNGMKFKSLPFYWDW